MAAHSLERRLRVEHLETRLALAVTVLESTVSILAETQYGNSPRLSEEATLNEVDSDGAVPFDSLTLHQATTNSHGHAEASITATAPPADGGTAPFGGSVTFFTEQHALISSGVQGVWASAHVHWTYTIEATGPVEVSFSYDAQAAAVSVPSPPWEPGLFTPVIRILGPKNGLVLDALTGNNAGSHTVLLEQADFSLPAQYTIDVWVGGAFSIGVAEHSEGQPHTSQQHTKSTRLEFDWTMSALPRVPDLEVYGVEYDQGYVYFSHLAQDYVGQYTVSLYRSSDEVYDPGVDVLVDSTTYTSSDTPYAEFGVFEVSDQEHRAAGLPYYLVVIDPQDAIAETSDSNNVAALSRPIISVKAIAFSQMAADILPDPGSPINSYEGPHYVDADGDGEPERAFPLLYSASSQVTLEKATFQAMGGLGDFVLIRGDGPGDFDFSEREATIVGEEMWVEDWVADAAFEQKVQKYDTFDIHWSISIDGGTTWSPAGSSQNTLYVTASDPQTIQLYHSVVDIAVRNANAANATDMAEIVHRIWSDFSDDRQVVRVDGQGIHYYGIANESVGPEAGLTTAEVLFYRRGDCSGLVKFFLDVLAVHGIQGVEINVEPIEPDEGFTLHNVVFDETQDRLLPGENEYFQGVLTPVTSNDSAIVINEASPGPGSPALGPTTVDLAWGFHRLAYVGGLYYDPSYGQTYATPKDFESAVTAFQRKNYITKLFSEKNAGRDLNGNGTATDMFLAHGLVWRKNTPTTDLVFTQLGAAGQILADTFNQDADELSTAGDPNRSLEARLAATALTRSQLNVLQGHTTQPEPLRSEQTISEKAIHEPLLAAAVEDTYSLTVRSGRLLRVERYQTQVVDLYNHIDEAFAAGASGDALPSENAGGVTL